MAGDRGPPRGQTLDVLLGHPDRVSEREVLVDETEVVQPGDRALAVLAEREGALDRRLHAVHVDRDLAEAIRRLLRAEQERLRDGLRPRGRQQHARVLGREPPVEVIEEREVFLLDAFAVQVHERLGEGPELARQRLQKSHAVEHELVDVAHTGGEGQSDSGVEIRADGGLAAAARLGAVGVEAHVVDRGAAAAQMPPRAERRRELRLEHRHEGPVEQVVLEVVVEHALLDRAQRAAVAVRVDEPRHEQLLAVADHACFGIRAAQCAPIADGRDARAGDEHGGVGEDAGVPLEGVREHVLAADQQVHGVSRAPRASR